MKPKVYSLLELRFLLLKYQPICMLLKIHANLQPTWVKPDWKIKLYPWWLGYTNFCILTIPEACPIFWLSFIVANEFLFKSNWFELAYLFFKAENSGVKACPNSSEKIRRGQYKPLMRDCATCVFIPLVIRNSLTSVTIHFNLEDDY